MSNQNISRGGWMALMKALGMHCRRETVHRLLQGNDTQCFTTEQYLEACIKDHDRHIRPGWLNIALARLHLASLNTEIKEVQSDVWAAIQDDLMVEEVF